MEANSLPPEAGSGAPDPGDSHSDCSDASSPESSSASDPLPDSAPPNILIRDEDSPDDAGDGEPVDVEKTLTVGSSDEGSRLDAWLHAQLPDQSRSQLKRWIQEGRVTVDGGSLKPSAPLRDGAEVVIRIPPPPPILPIAEKIPLEVLYEDDSLLVINKPADMVVHPSPGTDNSGTVVNALLGMPGELSNEGGEFRPGIVHRLDRETTGLLLVARTNFAHRKLAEQFKERTVKKQYVAFAHGHPRELEGELDLPIGRSPTQRKKMTIRHDEGGKPSQTRWQVERTLGAFTWFRLFPRTGRTHQIRVHLKYLGHPIVCDALYGREKQIYTSELLGKVRKSGEEPLLRHHALHAHRIRFQHPNDDRWLDFEAPLPPALAHIWDLAEPTSRQP